MRELVGVTAFAIACGGGDAAPRFEQATLVVRDSASQPDASLFPQATVHVTVATNDGLRCVTPDPAPAATYGGAAMIPDTPSTTSNESGCFLAFSLAIGNIATQDDTITVTAFDETITATFPAELLARREATPRDATAFDFLAGTMYTFGWSHPEDLARGGTELRWVGPHEPGSDVQPVEWSADGTVVEDEVSFVAGIPVGAADVNGMAVFETAQDAGIATACDGAAECKYELRHVFAHPARSSR